jgi:hypothetical protein
MGSAQDRMVYGTRQPVIYNDFYQPAPVVVHRRVIHTGWGGGWGGGWNRGWGGGWNRGWGGGWGGAYCAPPPPICW